MNINDSPNGTPKPLIYRRILQSQLVCPKELDHVYSELYQKLLLMAGKDPVSSGQNQSSSDISLDGTSLDDVIVDEKTNPRDSSANNTHKAGQGTASENNKNTVDSETDFVLNDMVMATDDSSQEKTDFELDIPEQGSGSFSTEFSDESREITLFFGAPFEEEMERFLPAELELRGLVNRWQVSQLLHHRTRFTLGRYRMIDSLGVGGYGHVFLGRSVKDTCNLRPPQCLHSHQRDVAVKVLPLKQATPQTIKKFLREIKLNSYFKHENIVQLIESAIDGNVHYTVQEYINGGDVRRLIIRHERVDYQMAAAIISQVADGLTYLHSEGLVHRDIKPGNILLMKNGDVKITDFGLAIPSLDNNIRAKSLRALLLPFDQELALLEENEIQSTHENSSSPSSKKKKVAGTPDYLSPDQIRDPDNPNPLWDIYSLGCTFYFMLTGIVPFPAGTTKQKMHAQLYCDPPEPRMFNLRIPEKLSKLVLQMMAKEPSDRVQSAHEIVALLRPWAASRHELSTYVIDKKTNNQTHFYEPPLEINNKTDIIDDSLLLSALEEDEKQKLERTKQADVLQTELAQAETKQEDEKQIVAELSNVKQSSSKKSSSKQIRNTKENNIKQSDIKEKTLPVQKTNSVENKRTGNSTLQTLKPPVYTENNKFPDNLDQVEDFLFRLFRNVETKTMKRWQYFLTFYVLLPLLLLVIVLIFILFIQK